MLLGGVFGTENTVQTKATTSTLGLNAAGNILVQADSKATIRAVIVNSAITTSLALAGGSDTVSVAGTMALNRVSATTEANLGNTPGAVQSGGTLSVTSDQVAGIFADVQSASVAVGAGLAGSNSGIAVGVTIARNFIRAENSAILAAGNALRAGVDDGNKQNIIVRADRTGEIDATVTASAIGVAAGSQAAVAVSAAGSIAVNTITGGTIARLSSSSVTRGNDLSVTAQDLAAITALVRATAASVAVSLTANATAVGAGLALAVNEIGWDSVDPGAATYASSDLPTDVTTLTAGQSVRIDEGPLVGRVYEYLGPTETNADLAQQNYEDRSLWKRLDRTGDTAQVQAIIENSSVDVDGDVRVTALSRASIDADVSALTVGVGVSAKAGQGISVGGAVSVNDIAVDVAAEIRGTSQTLDAASLTVTADNFASIEARSLAASISAALAPTSGTSISVGLGLALNSITGDTLAEIDGLSTITLDGVLTLKATSGGPSEERIASPSISAGDLNNTSEATLVAETLAPGSFTQATLDAGSTATVQALVSLINANFAGDDVLAAGAVLSGDSDSGEGWSLTAQTASGVTRVFAINFDDDGNLEIVTRDWGDLAADQAILATLAGLLNTAYGARHSDHPGRY